jgi:allantoicase
VTGEFTQLVDLAAERLGGRVLLANDEFFAGKEALLRADRPVFLPDKYTSRGKWMDGWETRRRRTPGHDWCLVRLGLPGILRGLVVDTSFFRGNFPSHCSLEACAVEGAISLKRLTGTELAWTEVLPRSPLRGDAENLFTIDDPRRYTHLRFNIHPDGGVARLRVHGEVVPDWPSVLSSAEIDLAAVGNGGHAVACSDMFFSTPRNLLMPGRAKGMSDGWETRRRRGPGHDWVVVKLGIHGEIHRVEIDTAHFKGNFPDTCSLDACETTAGPPHDPGVTRWIEAVPRSKLHANARHSFPVSGALPLPATHVRLNIFPDGGVSRLRVFGAPTEAGRATEGLRRLNALTEGEAYTALLACCGSQRVALALAAARPYASVSALLDAAEGLWPTLDREDWLAVFATHPRIGENAGGSKASPQAKAWSRREQAGVGRAGASLAELARANQAYCKRFGYIFIVCATGKTGEEMLAALEQRLTNEPAEELRIAADEQRKIARLRLERLLRP